MASLTILSLVLAVALPCGAEERKRITQLEATAAVVTKVFPDYPAIAKQLHLSGTVEVEVNIAADGTVESVKVVSGNPVLTKAAAAAVSRWKFKPFTANGEPVKAVALMSFDFKQ